MEAIATPTLEETTEAPEFVPVAFDMPFDTHRIFTLIFNTDDIDTLSARDYDSIIAFYAKEKIQSTIGSNNKEKIRLIVANILFSASMRVNLYLNTDTYNEEIFGHSIVLDAIKRSLRAGVDVNLILCMPAQDNSKFKDELVKLKGISKRFNVYTISGNSLQKRYVVTSDATACLEQGIPGGDIENDIARCDFNLPEKVAGLDSQIDEVVTNSTLI